MLDTGAMFPVWTAKEERLADLGAVLVRSGIPFGGFGGMTAGNLYKMPSFQVGELIFPELPVVASRQHLPCQMLLSATMFSGLIYEIDDCNHRLNITIPDTASTVRRLFVDEKMRVFCMNGEATTSGSCAT